MGCSSSSKSSTSLKSLGKTSTSVCTTDWKDKVPKTMENREIILEILGDEQTLCNYYFKPLYDPTTPFEEDKIMTILETPAFQFLDKRELVRVFERYRERTTREYITVQLVFGFLGKKCALVKNFVALLSEYGFSHVGLKIAPWYIDWTDECLTYPKPVKWQDPDNKYRNIYAVVDMKSKIEASSGVFQQLCTGMVAWNKNMGYDFTVFNPCDAMNKRRGNCHAYVNFLLNVLGVQSWWTRNSLMGQFMNQLKHETHDTVYKFQDAKFTTHQQLDDYYREQYPDQKPPDDIYELLRAYDKAFWFSGFPTEDCPFNEIQNDPRTLANREDNLLNVFRGDSDDEEDGFNNLLASNTFYLVY